LEIAFITYYEDVISRWDFEEKPWERVTYGCSETITHASVLCLRLSVFLLYGIDPALDVLSGVLLMLCQPSFEVETFFGSLRSISMHVDRI
jgi:hypothetical protein